MKLDIATTKLAGGAISIGKRNRERVHIDAGLAVVRYIDVISKTTLTIWFIVSGLQPVEKRVPENCAVEFQSALSAQQSWSYSFAGRIFARCTVKITKHPPYRRQELGRQQTTTAGPKSD